MNRYCAILLLLFFAACSHTTPYIRHDKNNAEFTGPRQRIIFVGDAGRARPSDKIWEKLGRYITSDSLVIFLGDNVYEYGLPDESENDSSYELYAGRLLTQINAAKKARKTVFIPGNHDWNNSRANGRVRILAQQNFVRKYGATFYPENGCAGIAAEKINEKTAILFIDSQALLDLPDEETGASPSQNGTACAIRNKRQYQASVAAYLDANFKPGTQFIIAAHHPLMSEGTHGGFFDWPHHIFPVYNYNKYVPLPVIASLVVLTRQWGWISSTDIAHTKYQKYLKLVSQILQDRKVLLYAAGHEHNLQLFRTEGPVKYHLISGSGSKKDSVSHNKQTILAWEEKGFFVLDLPTEQPPRLTMVGETADKDESYTLE